MSITACLNNKKWQAMISTFHGEYSKQAEVVPPIQEVVENTTQSNFDKQNFDKESTMKNINIMQCKDPCIAALQSGKEKDWNWSAQPFAVDPEKGNLYNVTDSSPLMKYSGVAVSSSSGSIKWGIRYLYVFKSQASYDFYEGCQNCSGKMYNPQWLNWDDTLNKYNSPRDPNHASYLPDVKGLYENGRNPHKDKKGKRKPPYMWPILTDGSARN